MRNQQFKLYVQIAFAKRLSTRQYTTKNVDELSEGNVDELSDVHKDMNTFIGERFALMLLIYFIFILYLFFRRETTCNECLSQLINNLLI